MTGKRGSDAATFGSGQTAGPESSGYTVGPMQAGPSCRIPQPLIQVEGFSLRYGTRTALDNISLDIYKGCITALIGPSGCGKTSFLSSINRLTDLIPGCEVTGCIRVHNSGIHSPESDVRALRRKSGCSRTYRPHT